MAEEIEESQPSSSEEPPGPRKDLVKMIGRYGIENVLQSFIDYTQPTEHQEKHIADLHARLVMALKTYQKSYDKD
tara:strand:- start:637 stop:861 length:225 start_codon:yes stop_codon:yes gene_type:complete